MLVVFLHLHCVHQVFHVGPSGGVTSVRQMVFFILASDRRKCWYRSTLLTVGLGLLY